MECFTSETFLAAQTHPERLSLGVEKTCGGAAAAGNLTWQVLP